MSKKASRAKAIAARDERIIAAIAGGEYAHVIAAREGLDVGYLKKIGRWKGWTFPDPPKLDGIQRSKKMQVGLTPASALFRGRVGGVVADLYDRKKVQPVDLSAATGVTQTNLRYSQQNPFPYDWTISQLERLAAYKGVNFVTFMREMLKP